MTYMSGVGTSGALPNDPAASGIETAAIARTGSATRSAGLRNTAVDEIASDSAKVSLAGTMLYQETQGSDVRFDKVAALRQSIEAGTYGVTSATVAGKLVEALQK